MDIRPYLDRIGYDGSLAPNEETLRQLHRRHLLSVPFENLDIHLGHPIVLAMPSFFTKIVLRRRGGFCYELNGLFGWLLAELGYPVTYLSARVFTDGVAGPEYDHLVLLVECEGRWIADVGFGDSFLEPIALGSPREQIHYQIVDSNGHKTLERLVETRWVPQYAFTMIPRRLEEFAEMCHRQQTSPHSIFTRKTVCSRATSEGRITLSNGRRIATEKNRREEREIADAGEFRDLLRKDFDMELDAGEDVHHLLRSKGMI